MRNIAHADLKPGMHVLTGQGWRIVKDRPVSWLAGTLLVRFADGTTSVQEPDYRWVRRINIPLPPRRTR